MENISRCLSNLQNTPKGDVYCPFPFFFCPENGKTHGAPKQVGAVTGSPRRVRYTKAPNALKRAAELRRSVQRLGVPRVSQHRNELPRLKPSHLLVFARGINSFQGFLGGAKRISSMHSMSNPGWLISHFLSLTAKLLGVGPL